MSAPVKPGWKTTEFWLTKLGMVLGGVIASGLPSDSKAVQVAGLGLSALSLLGYQASRASVKKSMAATFGATPVNK